MFPNKWIGNWMQEYKVSRRKASFVVQFLSFVGTNTLESREDYLVSTLREQDC